MIFQSINISKNKTLLDIISVLTIISIFTSLLSMFGITIPYLGFFGVPLFLAIILFISLIGFEWRMKKWGWIFLHLLVIIGLVVGILGAGLASANYTSSLTAEEFIEYSRTTKTGPITELPPQSPIVYKILFYGGQVVSLIGLLSFVLFYLIYYRKYLTGSLTLEEIGGEKFANREEFKQRWEQSETKQNTLNKIMMWIIFLLIIFIVGFLIAKAIFGF